ncbi:hypothetical protein [Janthinobacterium sp. NKUCC06_STL]|jgi:hypothetical protein|uniref:hypothetical protein n=1 Tax=Janthinobacterium sp. NKUCC06_STL TaxID=2842127 RepID=UPI001C5B10F5|nr:hypothetical protein [Janthinobacterium sp. NKUCC06_STL]MBW3512231.1 hypothetical protein [Janthinobacterium sp. NKUCC06_STL]
MMEKSHLYAIKAQMIEAKKLQEQSLKKLNEMKLKNGASMGSAQMKELNKAIKAVEKSLKQYTDI